MPTDDKKITLGDMYLTTSSETRIRAEAAMPGTRDLTPLLILEPPPIDPDLIVYGQDDDEDRDYGPDPVAEFSLSSSAAGIFCPQTLAAALTQELREEFRRPMFFVRTPKGRTTYMQSTDAPTEAIALIASWTLRDEPEGQVAEIATGAMRLAKWLETRPERFEIWSVNRAAIERQHERAGRILEVAPDHVSLVVRPETGGRFDGKKLWRALHAVGLQWGDCDQFQWSDPTHQTDYLFWAEVDDGELGYALPEEIAAGRQDFDAIHFGFTVPRTPHPDHVLRQMVGAADAVAGELGGHITPCIDGVVAESVSELEAAVDGVIRQLREVDVKPGAHAVCMLR